MIIVSQTCPPIIFPDLLITSCPTLLCTRGVPNENKMRHNLPFRNNITIEIQNMLPLAWSRRNGFFRSRSRSRLRNSHSVCLQTLPTQFISLVVSKIINSACVTRTTTDILTSQWWHFLITVNLVDEHEKTRNLITNTTKKELSYLMQSIWIYARRYISAIHIYLYC